MSENPFEPIFQTFQILSKCVQTQLSSLTRLQILPFSSHSFQNPSHPSINSKVNASQPVTKEELGSATWTFLHTLAAQYPERPTRQQKKDVKELTEESRGSIHLSYTVTAMAILSRMYPCKECADHFKEVLRANPVQAGSQADFSQWMCHVHNVVNRSLGKQKFPCERVDARWGKLDCEQRMCDLQGASSFPDDML